MKRILVPIDFSIQAECAIYTAAKIAKENGSDVHLLHMIDLPTNVDDLESHADASSPAKMLFLKKVHEKMKKVMLSDTLKGVKTFEEVRFRKTFSGILEYSKELDVDLIVMGSNGTKDSFKEMFIGSNTEKVVRNSNVPVLVVKKGMGQFDMKKMVFATDFSETIKPAFSRFLEFAKKFDASIDLLYINTPRNFQSTRRISQKLHDFLTEFDLPEHSLNIYNDKTIEKGILNYSDDADVDVIVMVTHQRSGISSLFNDSISEDLVNHSPKPVLTFKI